MAPTKDLGYHYVYKDEEVRRSARSRPERLWERTNVSAYRVVEPVAQAKCRAPGRGPNRCNGNPGLGSVAAGLSGKGSTADGRAAQG
jgi:hypothetical protein